MGHNMRILLSMLYRIMLGTMLVFSLLIGVLYAENISGEVTIRNIIETSEYDRVMTDAGEYLLNHLIICVDDYKSLINFLKNSKGKRVKVTVDDSNFIVSAQSVGLSIEPIGKLINLRGKIVKKVTDSPDGTTFWNYYLKTDKDVFLLNVNFNSIERRQLVQAEREKATTHIVGQIDRIVVGPNSGNILTTPEGYKVIKVTRVTY